METVLPSGMVAPMLAVFGVLSLAVQFFDVGALSDAREVLLSSVTDARHMAVVGQGYFPAQPTMT